MVVVNISDIWFMADNQDKTTATRTTLTEESNRVRPFLEGVPYPVDRNHLTAHASQNGAPESVMNILEQLPERSYESFAEVQDKIEEIFAERR